MNRENLTKLANYLDALPEDYRQFYMSDFTNEYLTPDELTRYQSDPTYNLCGSAACAVGHAPAAGIKVDPSNFKPNYDFSTDIWGAYMTAAFGINWESPKFEFMFGGGWSDYDNTPKGAAARIRYVLDGKSIPELPIYWNDSQTSPFDSYHIGYYPNPSEISALYQEYMS